MVGKLKSFKSPPPAASNRNPRQESASSNPSKADTPANLRTTFGVPKKK